MRISVQSAPFDAGEMLKDFTAQAKGAGAVVSFTGITRDIAGGLRAMEIEHYPGMTERALTLIAEEAMAQFALTDAWILHRFGRLGPNDPIMMVLTAARHRSDAFRGAEFLMDFLKSRAPFWKKELGADGGSWVDAKGDDEAALDRWSTPNAAD